jgi:hypothetical protein
MILLFSASSRSVCRGPEHISNVLDKINTVGLLINARKESRGWSNVERIRKIIAGSTHRIA